MKLKRVLCILASVFIFSCCVHVNAVKYNKHYRKSQMHLNSMWQATELIGRVQSRNRNALRKRILRRSKALLAINEIPEPEKEEKAEVPAQKIEVLYPHFDYTGFITYDDIKTDDFVKRMSKAGIYCKVSKRLKIYYDIWQRIENKY